MKKESLMKKFLKLNFSTEKKTVKNLYHKAMDRLYDVIILIYMQKVAIC